MKLFEQEYKYQYDWGTVTVIRYKEKGNSAFWLKYPNNIQKHIQNIDVIDRHIDTKEKVLKMKRIIHLKYYVPGLLKKLFNVDGTGLAIEEILINLEKKNLTINTVNYTLNPFVNITEKCEYFQKENDQNNTHYKQSTTLNINGLGYMKSLIENTIINTIREKSKQGISIMNDTIKRTVNDNIYINNLDKEKK